MKNCLLMVVIPCVISSLLSSQPANAALRGAPYRYAVVTTAAAYADANWKKVADTLLSIHGKTASQLFIWNSALTEVKNPLAAFQPDYIAYVCRPVVDLNSNFVHAAHQLTRSLNADPYYDAVFSFVTGYVAADALRAVTERVVIRTGIVAHWQSEMRGWFDPTPYPGFRYLTQQISRCEGIWNGRGTYPSSYYYFKDGTAASMNAVWNGQTDCIRPLCDWLNADSIHVEVAGQGAIDGPVDFLSTSGHGNIDSWQSEYPSALHEGYLRSANGQLFGAPLAGSTININAKTPKVYMASGNCLIGTPDAIGNLVYAWFHTGRAVNMFGYIVTSGYGYNGWGDLERMLYFNGRYNAPEAFFATMQSMAYDLDKRTPGTEYSTLLSYQENVAVFGDPKADAYTVDYGDSSRAYLEKLVRKKASSESQLDTFVYTVTASHFPLTTGADMYFYRGLRPFCFLPVIIDPATVIVGRNDGRGAAIQATNAVWDLVHPGDTVKKGQTRTLVWRAKTVREYATTVFPQAGSRFSRSVKAEIIPVPTASSLCIRCRGFSGQRLHAKVYTAAGKKVAERVVYNVPSADGFTGISFGGAVKGMYIVLVFDGNLTVCRRISRIR